MFSDPQVWVSLLTLTALEVVLSIDNLVVIAVLVGKLPPERQAQARYIGMTLALIPRLILLFFISWIIGLTEPLFELFGHGFSGKDLILAAGGLFLIYKATHEIHGSLEGDEGENTAKVHGVFVAVIVQIAIINLVFSIDSIVTAVGMANEIWVMAVAVILSMVVLMAASKPVGDFVERHPTVKVLALGFLIMIGMTLVADGFGAHVPKGYIYTAMVFSIAIEAINMVQRRRQRPVHLRNPYGTSHRKKATSDAPSKRPDFDKTRRVTFAVTRLDREAISGGRNDVSICTFYGIGRAAIPDGSGRCLRCHAGRKCRSSNQRHRHHGTGGSWRRLRSARASNTADPAKRGPCNGGAGEQRSRRRRHDRPCPVRHWQETRHQSDGRGARHGGCDPDKQVADHAPAGDTTRPPSGGVSAARRCSRTRRSRRWPTSPQSTRPIPAQSPRADLLLGAPITSCPV